MTVPELAMPIIAANNIHKTYRLGRVDVPVLRGASIKVEPGEWVAILGASGSGKSTLLHILGGLDRPDRRVDKCPECGYGLAGLETDNCPQCGGQTPATHGSEVQFQGRNVARFSAHELDAYRNAAVGFVFQFYHLLPELAVLENVLLGAMIRGYAAQAGRRRPETRERAGELLESFGLGKRLRHRPAELSGGERQRVAIARALINDPPLLLADEPTGNLDRKTGAAILDAVTEHRRRTGRTLVVVTHDPDVAGRADRIVCLEDGRIVDGSG
jgi:ABC-type lipoprotein export system ATPase subunit